MKKQLKILFIFVIVMVLSYVLVFYYLDQQNSQIKRKPCEKIGDKFVLYFKRPALKKKRLEIINLRPGRIFIRTKQRVNEIELVTNENIVIKTEKLNNHLFQKAIKKNLVISAIHFIPKSNNINRINVAIYRKPIFSLSFILYQIAFLFAIFFIGSMTGYFLYSMIIEQKNMQSLPFRMLLYAIIILIMLVFIYFVLNLDEFLNHVNRFDPLKFWGRTLLFNSVFALSLIFLFFLFSFKHKGKNLPFGLPVFFCLPIIFLKIPFSIEASADSLLWVINLSSNASNISFAESLSLMLNKFSFYFFNLVTPTNARTSLIYTGKIMGVLFVFSLFCFINSLSNFTHKKKLLFFLLFLTFSFSALLLGFPEFRYYPLPFLIFSFLAAQKYIRDGYGKTRYLIISALLVVIAGLFHGTAYFSLPIIFLLPLLKDKTNNHIKSKSFFLKQYSAIFIVMGTIFLLFFFSIQMLNFNLKFNTVSGGFDGRQFISFFPENNHFPHAVNFTEIAYFSSRGWIFFITGSFIFLFFFCNWKKRVSLTKSDFILFLFGISQFLIVLFWGFDNGIREFDLYIAPTTLLYLFLIRYLMGTIQSEKSAWKYIVVFSLFSPFYPLIIKLIGS